jgi:transcription antitermination factor NusG
MLENYSHDRSYAAADLCAALADTSDASEGWHVLWTHSNHERSVYEQLAAKHYEVFLPMITQWSGRKTGAPVCKAPMFRSYLFLRCRIDKRAYLDICNTKGLVSILGARWDKLSRIPEQEIAAIKLVMESQLPTMPYPWLSAGTAVRIKRGSLANTQGVLVESDHAKGLFVISVNLLQRSIAVSVDCIDVEPV